MADPFFPQATADLIAQVVERAGATQRLFWKDEYQIIRYTQVKNQLGGRKDVETVAESGKCLLMVGNLQGQEGSNGQVFQGYTIYSLELPETTILKVTDRIKIREVGRITWRQFDVTDVKRAESDATYTEAQLEEHHG